MLPKNPPLKEALRDRLRKPPPSNAFVVEGSIPIVSFGNCLKARCATLGLNPSPREFLDREGLELQGPNRRLATLGSLGTNDLGSSSDEVVDKALNSCLTYFQGNPYLQWFRPLENILNAIGASYFDNSACHLDLVQWATNPTWGKLSDKDARNSLLQEDSRFLRHQLENPELEILLVNGSGVKTHLSKQLSIHFMELDPIEGFSHQRTRLFEGNFQGRLRILAWSTNLQSSRGVTIRLKEELARRIGKHLFAGHQHGKASAPDLPPKLMLVAKSGEPIKETMRKARLYDKLRRCNPQQFSQLFNESLRTGTPFDQLVEQLP